jgi:hypothetical protein
LQLAARSFIPDIRFPKEIRRRSAASKSNTFALRLKHPFKIAALFKEQASLQSLRIMQ